MLFLGTKKQINEKRTKHMQSKINKTLETRNGHMGDEGATSDINLEQLG